MGYLFNNLAWWIPSLLTQIFHAAVLLIGIYFVVKIAIKNAYREMQNQHQQYYVNTHQPYANNQQNMSGQQGRDEGQWH